MDQRSTRAARPIRNRLAHPLAFACACAALAAVAVGQVQRGGPAGAPNPHEAAATALRLDVQTLLSAQEVFSGQLNDPVYHFPNHPDRQLVQIPFRVVPGQAVELSPNAVSFRGGRLLAWRIEYAAENQRQHFHRGGHRTSDFQVRGLEPGPDGQTPQGAPRLARRIEVTADGRFTWEIERLVGLEVSNQSVFAYRIDPRMLSELRPQLERLTRNPNETPADFNARRRESQQQIREMTEQFNALREQVAELPDTFTTTEVERVWAVLEVRRGVQELSIAAPDELRWSISLRHLEALRELAMRRGQQADPATMRELATMVRTPQPLNIELIAVALGQSGALQAMQLNDPLHRFVQQAIAALDEPAVHPIIEQLTMTIPPTDATIALMDEAAAKMTPQLRLMALRARLSQTAQDTAAARQAATSINQAISEPHGVDPRWVMTFALELANTMPEQSRSLFVSAVRFDQVPADRLEAVISAVIAEAGIDPIASRWLDVRLLGSSDVDVTRATLELLAQARKGSQAMRQTVNVLFTALFQPSADPTAAAGRNQSVELDARIFVDSINHALFRAVQHGDPQVRELTWEAMHAFTFSPTVATREREAALERRAERQQQANRTNLHQLPQHRQVSPMQRPQPSGQDTQTFDLHRTLVDAALLQTEVPPQLVTFLAAERDSAGATGQLVRLVLTANDATVQRAAAALNRSGMPLAEALNQLNPQQRHQFAILIYRHLTGTEPMAVGLLLDPSQRSQVVRWFAEQLVTSGPPEPAQWILAFPNENALLQLAGGSDAGIASGAVAVMVASVGGDEADAAHFLRTLNMTDRSHRAVQEAWAQTRQTIYTQRLEKSQGRYRLILNVYGSADAADPTRQDGRGRPGAFPHPEDAWDQPRRGSSGPVHAPATPLPVQGPPQQVIPLGTVRLDVVDDSVRFAEIEVRLTIPDSHMAIVIETVGELGVLPVPQLAQLPLMQVSHPLQLTPRPDGTWSGWVMLDRDRYLELVMHPIR